MVLRPITGGASLLVAAAAIAPRRARPQLSHLYSSSTSSPLSDLTEKALMLIDAVSAALSDEAGKYTDGELICSIGIHSYHHNNNNNIRLGI